MSKSYAADAYTTFIARGPGTRQLGRMHEEACEATTLPREQSARCGPAGVPAANGWQGWAPSRRVQRGEGEGAENAVSAANGGRWIAARTCRAPVGRAPPEDPATRTKVAELRTA